jgi:flagellar L-ring protein precursor FlgH
LNGSISAVVQQVLSNGNLVIFGEKEIELNEGSEYIMVRGIVRPQDIQPNNTVLSRRLANAQFSYSGVGALANSTKVPVGTRLLYTLWPF